MSHSAALHLLGHKIEQAGAAKETKLANSSYKIAIICFRTPVSVLRQYCRCPILLLENFSSRLPGSKSSRRLQQGLLLPYEQYGLMLAKVLLPNTLCANKRTCSHSSWFWSFGRSGKKSRCMIASILSVQVSSSSTSLVRARLAGRGSGGNVLASALASCACSDAMPATNLRQ